MSTERTKFDEWMKKVDRALEKVCYLTSADLPDQPYYDWFEDGYTPGDAAVETLEEIGFPLH